MITANMKAKLSTPSDSRKYDIVVLGATGFTGRYICEHLVDSLPTDCTWAIAGRSVDSLNALCRELRDLNRDRPFPDIEQCTLAPADLSRLARSTRILITAIGPYSKYGTPVIEACIDSGTHYFDVTGEAPWVHRVTQKYDQKAKACKSIIIPQIGVESAPADMLSWALVTHIQRTMSAQTGELVLSVDLRGSPSGGTVASVCTVFEAFSLAEISNSLKPWALSPIGPCQGARWRHGLAQRLLGIREVPILGKLTTSLNGAVDATEVYRSHGLIDKGQYYGPKFSFQPYAKTRSNLAGILTHLVLTLGAALLILPPVRALLRMLVHAPGQGPPRQSSKDDRIEYQAIAHPDAGTDDSDPARVFGRLRWDGSLYHLTGTLAAQGAITLLKDETLAAAVGGGFLTPAMLGEAYIDRLQREGVKIDVETVP